MKLAHLAVSKSGSNILRNELGWQGRGRINIRAEEKQYATLWSQINHGDIVMGHLHYTERAAEALKDHFIIFQYRDPRDTIVSRHYWMNEIDRPYTWEESLRRTAVNMLAMEPWFEHCNLAISYEHLVKKSYPKTHTFRKGVIGRWKTEFPDDLWDLYDEICEPVKYWEYDACIHCG